MVHHDSVVSWLQLHVVVILPGQEGGIVLEEALIRDDPSLLLQLLQDGIFPREKVHRLLLVLRYDGIFLGPILGCYE